MSIRAAGTRLAARAYDMITILRIAGFVTLLALGFGVVFTTVGVSPWTFIDLPALIFVVGGVLGILLIGNSSTEWGCAVACIFRWSAFNDPAKRKAAARFFRLGRRASWASGGIAMVTAATIMLGNVGDDSSFYACLSVALLPLFYGMILAEMVFHPLAFAAAREESDGS